MVAAAVGGMPSTIHAIARGRDPLESTRATGSIVTRTTDDRIQLSVAVPVHLAASLFWAAVLVAILPSRRRLIAGGLSGLAIGLFDLRVVGRAFPSVHHLGLGPQLADHFVFGLVVAALSKSDD